MDVEDDASFKLLRSEASQFVDSKGKITWESTDRANSLKATGLDKDKMSRS